VTRPSASGPSLAYDQRSFNAAALRLVDDLQEQVDRLQAELRALRDEKR
jgi:hypothetical protein